MDEQVDTISYYNKQVDPSSNPKEDTHSIDRIRKVSVRPILFKPAVIGQDLVTSVRETLCDGLSPNILSVKEIVTDALCNSAQVNRFAVQPGVNVDVFSPSRSSNSSFAKWPRNIDPLDTSVDGFTSQERNSNFSGIEKVGVKSFPGEIVAGLDPIKRVNLAKFRH